MNEPMDQPVKAVEAEHLPPAARTSTKWRVLTAGFLAVGLALFGRGMAPSRTGRGPRQTLKLAGRALLPMRMRRRILHSTRWPPVGSVELNDLRRLRPVSRVWGADRGTPVDRYYIERFLSSHSGDIRGRVLEIGDDTYTKRFGSAVERSDVLYHSEGNDKATIVLDLTKGTAGEENLFDCVICTQTLQQIFDAPAALETLVRLMKPGGTLLLTLPGISQIDRPAFDDWGDYWRFTTRSVEHMLGRHFASEHVTVQTCGNVLSAVAFLHGLAAEELTSEELDHVDPDYQVLLTARAVKT